MVSGSTGTLITSQLCLVSCLFCYVIPTAKLASSMIPCITSAEGPYLPGNPGMKISRKPFLVLELLLGSSMVSLFRGWRGLWLHTRGCIFSEHIIEKVPLQHLYVMCCLDCLLAWQWREPREGMWKPDWGPPRQSRRKIAPFSLLLPRAQPCLQAGTPTSVTACQDSVSVLTFLQQAEPGVPGAQPFSNWWAGEWLQPSWPWKCPTEVCHCHFSWEIAFGLSTFSVVILFQGETVPSTTGGGDGRPSLPWCVSPHLKAQLLGTLWRGAPQTGEVHRWEKNVAWKSEILHYTVLFQGAEMWPMSLSLGAQILCLHLV